MNRYKRYLQEKESGSKQDKGDMTVKEAGQLGGQKGGQRERELVAEGKKKEQQERGKA